MKVLLIHSEDDPETGPWASLAWDQIVDLGMGGVHTCERWNRRFQCPIASLSSMRNGFEDLRRVRELLGQGCGRLVDEHGLDWWEIMSLLLHGEMETFVALQHFVQTVGSGDEVFISRPGLHASLVQSLLSNRVQVFPLRRSAKRTGLAHYLRVSHKLSAAQMVDVFWDKYDSGYQLRGRIARKPQPSQRPAVLLPTAYVNVSRTGVAYANTFPEENFLLVTTRRSGWVQDLPPNVAAAWLSSYASLRDRRRENADMQSRWQSLLAELNQTKEFEILNRLGFLDSFPRRFRHGFEVRDAWRNVLDSEPVQGVLCADDSNPYTRIPLLLAQARGLPNIACHHGALDGRYAFKRTYGDVIWAKGKMEEDYLVRTCGVPPERVEIAAPALPANWNTTDASKSNESRPYVLFFSEASDITGGRQEEFYRDILPPLAELALATRHTLVVKLHPAESEPERSAMLARILTPQQRSATLVVSGSLTEDLLSKAWFGITILSTVAMECAIRGIPCFLCKWLECSPFGYVEQFIRFGVGVGLNHPDEIKTIPQYLKKNPVNADRTPSFWQFAAPGLLHAILSASPKANTMVHEFATDSHRARA
jgi:hypothetical protein